MKGKVNFWLIEFDEQTRLWNEFDQRMKSLKIWIEQAETLTKEQNDEFSYLIEKHEQFFSTNHNELIERFVRAGENLLKKRDQIEHVDLQKLINEFQFRFDALISYASFRLLFLKFQRTEQILLEQFQKIDHELDEEMKLFIKQDDVPAVLRRHNEYFHRPSSEFQSVVDSNLRKLNLFVDQIRQNSHDQWIERERIDERTRRLNNYFDQIQTKIKDLQRKLQMLPQQLRDYREK